MQQIVQNYKTGELCLEEVPTPICKSGGVLVRSTYSLVSAGTERMKVTQARMSMIQMAKARPDKVRQVIQSVKQVGLKETIAKVKERLDALTPLGYSLAGVVEEVGGGLDEFATGDRVACAGEKIACHAQYVSVPRNLCVRVPDGVDLKDAAFTTVGAIAMQGVRQANAMLGETVVVIGLGLVGLLAVQLLKAAGCRVIGVDLDQRKVQLAKDCGADLAVARDDPSLADAVFQLSNGVGADVAYISASTKSTDPMELAGKIARDRGKVVVVGMITVEADWQVYYNKELSVVLSRSYGPGRYDRNYEQRGIDYPVGYVRWTLRRNMEEFLRLISIGLVSPSRLTPEVFAFEEAPTAYQALHDSGKDSAVAMLFEYPADTTREQRVQLKARSVSQSGGDGLVGIGLIGAGNFTTGTLIPALKRASDARLKAICSAGGLSAKSAARRHGFEYCASDYHELLSDEGIHAVVIATHHDTHARFAVDAMKAGKHVFVEKPLALAKEQLDEIIDTQAQTGKIIMPGFNRRFSPLSVAVCDFFAGRSSPIEVVCRVNAGELKADSWYQDPEEGGWRILSEGCHFIDLIQFICGCPPAEVFAQMIGGDVPGRQNDNCSVVMKMADGSVGTLIYISNGDPCYEKERVEVFGQGRVAVIENWRKARRRSAGNVRTVKPPGPGKGHREEIAAFVNAVREGGAQPLPFPEAVAVTATTFSILESLRVDRPVPVVF